MPNDSAKNDMRKAKKNVPGGVTSKPIIKSRIKTSLADAFRIGKTASGNAGRKELQGFLRFDGNPVRSLARVRKRLNKSYATK